MTYSHGRCAKGERLGMGFPYGHRKTAALVAGWRMTGMVALYDGSCSIPITGGKGHRDSACSEAVALAVGCA